jgi:hypothetical protein
MGNQRAHLSRVQEDEDSDDAGAYPSGQRPLALSAMSRPSGNDFHILDSEASETTIGSNTPVYDRHPVNLTLKMTGNSTSNVFRGRPAGFPRY